ncbi:hypothetical protein J7E29_04550 [Streptomyces sp. ISL-90]|nr:hypothetical protein [Streptomyces sp. ISL-90]
MDLTQRATGAPTGFHIMMPPGWTRFIVDDEGKRQLVARMSARLKNAGRPDLDAQARTLIEVQWRRLLSIRASAVYLPGERDDEVLTPMSIAMKQFVSPPDVTFESAMRSLAGRPVDVVTAPWGPIFRWQSTERGTGELAEVQSRQIGYGFPLPGEHPRRGLLFFTSIPALADTDATMLGALAELSDSIMETFRWR